jgi:hypothetical protein
MKTQISSLVKGNQFVAGTSYKVRENISKMVNKENPYTIKVKVKDHIYDMTCYYCSSGKSYIYETTLSPEQVKDILPNDIKALQHPELVNVIFVIQMDMTCEYQTFRRRTERSAWKQGITINVPESDVTIL